MVNGVTMATIDELFKLMVEQGASDLHITSGAPPYLRLHGNMVPLNYRELSNQDVQGLIFEILSEKQKKAFVEKWELDCAYTLQGTGRFRCNIFMQRKGLGAVFRIIPEKIKTAQELGLPPAILDLIDADRGLVLVTGPTGSGKTTTLYSVLHELPRDKLNVSTLENPVEYQLAGVNQVNIKEDGISTFEGSLRALMRQDPDVILVGEIRDHQTANLAFKAASTGHLVFSTVHANGSKEVVERLLNLGVDTFTIKNNLRLSAAQRLVPLICSHCSKDASTEETELLGLSGKFKTMNAEGCSQCKSGVIGRIAVLEYMGEDEIKQFIDSPKESGSLPKRSLKKEVLELAQLGKIDFSEVIALI